MGRKNLITKEEILEKSFELLRNEGCNAVNISRIARELRMSTQPISWQFGSMDGLRSELLVKATTYMNSKIAEHIINGDGSMLPSAALALVGKKSVDFVFDEPNISEFIRFTKVPKINSTMIPTYDDLKKAISQEFADYNVTEEMAASFIRDCIVYTQGLSTLIFSGSIAGTRKYFHKMQEEFGVLRLVSLGVPKDVVIRHLSSGNPSGARRHTGTAGTAGTVKKRSAK